VTSSPDWLSAIGILLSGLILGAMIFYAFRRKGPAIATDTERRELEAKRDSLIAQLRELDEAGDATPEERGRLEMEAAEVLRRLERAGATTTPAAAAAEPPRAGAPSGMNPTVKGFIWGASSVAVLALLGYYVFSQAIPKESATPNAMAPAPPSGMGAQQAPDPQIEQLEAAVQAHPDDVDQRMVLVKAYLERENLMKVFEHTKAILEKNPNEPRAMTYHAIVRMAMGQTAEARTMLTAATKSDPALLDAWVALAWANTQLGKKTEAEAAIESAIRKHPEEEKRLREVWAQMAARGAERKEGSLPEGHPPIEPVPGAAPAAPAAIASAAPAAGEGIHLSISLAKSAPPNSVLYVMAREAGQAGGPPIAVRRIAGATFPLEMDLTSADSMMGQPLPAKVRIDARLDADGDAATKSPSDPKATADGAAAGSRLSLVLQ
jgi:cytochrome c-type biogenesis protein CcmH